MIKKGKVRSILLAMSFGMGVVMQPVTQTFALQTNDFEEVQQYIKEYFSIVDKSYAELSLSEEVCENYLAKDSVAYATLSTNIEHRKLQISDLHYEDYKTVVNVDSVERKADAIYVTATKRTDMYFRCMNGEASSIIEEHRIKLRTDENAHFIIESDEYGDDFEQELKKESGALEKREEKILNVSKNVVASKKIRLKQLKNEEDDEYIADLDEVGEVPSLSAGSLKKHKYNRIQARKYAYKYVMNPNGKYENFEKIGGNCTNFTSQCLKAGGIKEDKTGNYKWYYDNSSNRAPSWSKANEFRKYYRKNVGSSKVKGLRAKKCSFESTRMGDLVQLVSNNEAKHTMIITTAICEPWGRKDLWKYKYDVGICQNSTGEGGRLKNVPLSTKPQNREYVHIIGSYY